MNNWSMWDKAIHNKSMQIKKQEKAVSSDCKPINIIKSSGVGEFASSRTGEVYSASLSNCNCVSFQHDRVPCKHMYRLAFEIGEMVSYNALSYAYAKPEALNLFDGISKEASELFMSHCFTPAGQYFKVENTQALQELASINFIEMCTDNSIITGIQLLDMKKDDLFELSKDLSDCPKKSSKKQIFIDFVKSHLEVIKNIGEPPCCVCVSHNVDGLINTIKAAYHRKYPHQEEWVLDCNGSYIYNK